MKRIFSFLHTKWKISAIMVVTVSMMNTTTKQRKSLWLKMLVVFVALIGIVLAFLLLKTKSNKDDFNFILSKNCKNDKPVFNYPPVNLEKTKVVVPLGLMLGDHVTPVDHQYFQDFSNTEADIEVISPGKGKVTVIERMSKEFLHKGKTERWEDYRLIVEHTCSISSIYIHVSKISDKLTAKAPKTVPGFQRVNIPVEAGEVLGWFRDNVDYSLVDETVRLPGLLIDEHYASEPWKVHVADTLRYFNQGIVQKMTAKSLRSEPPYAGKFDWDVDGKLQGNWFEVGTDYYAGADNSKYWVDQISISPDYLDHDHFIISMGKFNGKEAQYAVKNNSPDPAKVGVETGLIKYELVDYDYFTVDGTSWRRDEFAKIKEARNLNNVAGVVLVQMIGDRKLKFEAFPGKTGEQVKEFTSAAKIFER